MDTPEKLLKDLSLIDQSQSAVDKEYKIILASKKYQVSTENIRQLLKHYQRQKIEDKWQKSSWKWLWNIELKLEWINQCLSEMDIFQILEYFSRLSVLIGIIFFLGETRERIEEREDQQKQANYQAWNVLLSSEGKSAANAGRIDALQDLNKAGNSLAGIKIQNAILTQIDLRNARLMFANFHGSTLDIANFQGAYLSSADFSNTTLSGANFQDAFLLSANFQDSFLYETDFTNANLTRANLFNADLSTAILTDADVTIAVYNDRTRFPPDFDPKTHQLLRIEPKSNLVEANLIGTHLVGANFSECDLTLADLSQANLSKANLRKANLTDARLEGADLTKANFTDSIGLTIEQVKTAKNWDKALYSPDFYSPGHK